MAIYNLEAFHASDHVLTVSGQSESLQQRRDSDVLKERFFMLLPSSLNIYYICFFILTLIIHFIKKIKL
jgi:hypothetical protein